ncbi:MAG: DNA primase [Salinivirgaceae bacterium]|nr:DNA primase [Salinivirgaceae bacterium]
MIDKSTIDRIFNAADVVEVVSDFVQLKRRGVNYIGCCPFHNEKTPSFTVSKAKGIYKCFGCGKGGNSVNFIMEHEQMSYVEALRYLADKYHIQIEEKELTPEQQQKLDAREAMLLVNQFAAQTFSHDLFHTDQGKHIGYQYFKERGLTDETIKTFNLGFCVDDGRNYLTKLALSKGYQEKYLVETGLSIKNQKGELFDRFAERVIYPIQNIAGKIIGFGGRTLRPDFKERNIGKYQNSPESEIYDKKKTLYGIYQAKQHIISAEKCYLVEGYMDVLSMYQNGVKNVVASSGTSLTTDQVKMLCRFTKNVTVLYDGDAAGIHAAIRGVDMLLDEGLNVRVVLWPDGEDPDSFAQSHSSTELMEYINQHEEDFILFKTNLLFKDASNDPIKRASLIGDIVGSIAKVKDSIARAVYIKECAQRMDINENVLNREMGKKLNIEFAKQYAYEPQPQPPTLEHKEQPIVEKQSTLFDKKCEALERELVRLMITYGNNLLFIVKDENEVEEDKQYTVAKYILIETDGELEMRTPLCKKFFDLYKQIIAEGKTPENKDFTQNADPEISSLAAELLMISEQTVNKKLWEKDNQNHISIEADHLEEVVKTAINTYKSEIVIRKLEEIQKEMAELQKQPNNAEQMAILVKKYTEYTEFKKDIAKCLGNRTILGK